MSDTQNFKATPIPTKTRLAWALDTISSSVLFQIADEAFKSDVESKKIIQSAWWFPADRLVLVSFMNADTRQFVRCERFNATMGDYDINEKGDFVPWARNSNAALYQVDGALENLMLPAIETMFNAVGESA
jgi:hypothetical protein